MKPRRFVLLDRDGTLNVERHYLSKPDDMELLPGVLVGLQQLRKLGLGLVVITNQSAIGRGYFDLTRLHAIHDRLQELVAQVGIQFDGIYVCPHIPEDECSCRKPEPGLVLRAAQELQFDLSQSFVVGDKACDVELGQCVGATTLLVQTGYGSQHLESGIVWPDFAVNGLAEVAQIIERILTDTVEETIAGLTEDAEARVRQHLLSSIATKQRLLEECQAPILAAAEIITSSLQQKTKLLLCGNGGSAADSQHIAGEFVSVLNQNFLRPGLPAIALTTDTSILTASANDFGFEGVFERQVQALGQPGDVLLGISSSGNSENVVRATRYAKEHGIRTIALTGGPSSALAELAEVAIRVPSKNVQHIQEAHITIGHILCDLVERGLFPGGHV